MVNVFFATNRKPLPGPDEIKDFGVGLRADEVEDVRFGLAQVGCEADDAPRFELWKGSVAGDSAGGGDAAAGSDDAAAGGLFGSVLRKMRRHRRDTILYIHGFDYTFCEALGRAAELKRWFGARPMNWVLFTWPADGTTLPVRYHSERNDAAASGVAMGRGLLRATDVMRKILSEQRESQDDQPYGQRFHLMAHSMGAYVLRHALQHMLTERGDELHRLFDQIVLLAPDDDRDAFSRDDKLGSLPRLGKRVTTYFHKRDLALLLSNWTKLERGRLGVRGPTNLKELCGEVGESSFCFVECSRTASLRDGLGHQYYRRDERVRDDILRVLAGTPPHEISGRMVDGKTGMYRMQP